jgi:hypothetical protein
VPAAQPLTILEVDVITGDQAQTKGGLPLPIVATIEPVD